MCNLAKALIHLRGKVITNQEADKVKDLYDELPEYDKRPVAYIG